MRYLLNQKSLELSGEPNLPKRIASKIYTAISLRFIKKRNIFSQSELNRCASSFLTNC
ncbi:hypothetical protein DESC_270005 [Desulfosarcina cetonica]|nr:hypothetical protein DESC_270005 [Desulfosarcina cetonica]